MTRKFPNKSVNVQWDNPYIRFDRGLFLARTSGITKYARIHEVKWNSVGPEAGVSYIEFKVMIYDYKPMSLEDIQSGRLLTSPDGTQWFNGWARGLVCTPIVAEYWATLAYTDYYAVESDAVNLTQEELDRKLNQARRFTEITGAVQKIKEIKSTIHFTTPVGSVLRRTDAEIVVFHTRNDAVESVLVDTIPDGKYDPLKVAMEFMKSFK